MNEVREGEVWRTAVIGENGSVASGEVECARLGVADEDGGAGFALVEVEPLLSLEFKLAVGRYLI
jgi:hypothetical protein